MMRIWMFAGIGFALFFGLSLVESLRSGEAITAWTVAADLMETAALAGAVLFTALASTEVRSLRRERRDLLADLDRSRNESVRWRQAVKRHVDGLSKAIAEQFRAWRLTEAEADVATLMLKGLSHKEIALLRDSSEATVRQHAARIYSKSGLDGRAQLTAFFLEDLLAPEEVRVTKLAPVGRDAG